MKRSLLADTRPRAVVLLSGGIDSAVALAATIRDGFAVTALLVDYHQRNAAQELARATMQAGLQRAPIARCDILRFDLSQRGGSGVSPHYVPGRNGVLIALAFSLAESIDATRVVVGATAEDLAGFPDCRPAYFTKWAELASLGMAKAPAIVTPLAAMSKGDVIRLGLELGVDLAKTWSCYADASAPCGTCGACVARARGFADAGINDPLETV